MKRKISRLSSYLNASSRIILGRHIQRVLISQIFSNTSVQNEMYASFILHLRTQLANLTMCTIIDNYIHNNWVEVELFHNGFPGFSSRPSFLLFVLSIVRQANKTKHWNQHPMPESKGQSIATRLACPTRTGRRNDRASSFIPQSVSHNDSIGPKKPLPLSCCVTFQWQFTWRNDAIIFWSSSAGENLDDIWSKSFIDEEMNKPI